MESLGERIKNRREQLGWTQAKLADLLNVKIGTLSGYERNYRQPDAKMLQLLCANLKVTADYLLGLSNQKEPLQRQLTRIPILGQIRAGIPLLNPDNYAGDLDIPSDMEADFALQVVGDSMIGVGILDGDYAICREAQVAQSGQIVVALHDVAIGMSEATLKYFFAENDTRMILRAANPDYEDITMDGYYRIAGIMVALCRKSTPSYRVFSDYISVRDYTMEDWNEVIQLGIQYGITPEQTKQLLRMQWDMAKRIAGK